MAGQAGPFWRWPSVWRSCSPRWCDLTGDGKPEIVCNSGGYLGYAGPDWSNATKPWAWHSISPKGTWHKYTHGIGFGDINGDGRPDLAVANRGSGDVSVLRNLGGRSIAPEARSPAGREASHLAAADLDGDGKVDLPVGSWSIPFISVLRNSGDGTFLAPQGLPAWTEQGGILAADLDGDGRPDLITMTTDEKCVLDLGASIIKANYSRYVVDLNRAHDSAALYASSPTSPVCPTQTFAGSPIYMGSCEPDAREVSMRVERYWRPYHDRIAAELGQMRAQYGRALLWDAHSIASEIPELFAGVLPEFNFGTRDGASCPREISQALLDIVTTDGRFGAVLDGRFKGGYITLHYGKPAESTYAVQLELAQRTYMNEGAQQGWDPGRSRATSELIARVLERYLRMESVHG